MQRLKAMLILISLLSWTKAIASPPTCQTVLEACRKTVNSQNKTIQLQHEVLKTQEAAILQQNTEVKHLKKENRKSKFLNLGLGTIILLILI